MIKRVNYALRLVFSYIRYFVQKCFFKKPIRVYYWRERTNFGDLLTPSLLKYYGYSPIHFYPNRAQLVATGSLIEHLHKAYSGVILGTGAMNALTLIKFTNAKVIALRGPLTKKVLNITTAVNYGDPGLLASRLLKCRNTKKFKLGFIPHYKDIGNVILPELEKKFKTDITIIDVQNQPLTVLNRIDECEYVLSSSLHGLICSDALGIPNGWIPLSDLGSDFKFRDYYASVGREFEKCLITGEETLSELIGYTSHVSSSTVESMKDNLETQFKNLLHIIYD